MGDNRGRTGQNENVPGFHDLSLEAAADEAGAMTPRQADHVLLDEANATGPGGIRRAPIPPAGMSATLPPETQMAKAGSKYQDQAAAFFRSLGLSAEVEADIEGARGKHEIDVWVTGKLHPFDVRWVVECKDWKSNVPKEKVLALQTIVQDVGADRGFLLSETGFQGGAVRCAHNTNITLASLEDLREQTSAYLTEATLAAMHLKLEKVMHDLHAATTWTVTRTNMSGGGESSVGESVPGSIELTGRLSMLQHKVFRALHEGFPVVYDFTKDERPLLANSPDELIVIATQKITEAEEFIEKTRHLRPANALD